MSERVGAEQSQFQVNLDLIRNRPDAYQRVRQAADAFKQLTDPTPGDYSDYWSERWEAFGTIIGADIPRARVDRSRDEVQELHGQGRKLVLRPEGITLAHLGQIHTSLGSWATQPNSPVESDARFGYLDIEKSTKAPNLRTNVADLARIAQETGRHGMTLETYIIGSEDHFDLTGEYFDHGYQTWSRLPGSRRDGRVLHAYFYADGYLSASSTWTPDDRHDGIGGRFEGVK